MKRTLTLLLSIIWLGIAWGQEINLNLQGATLETFVKAVQEQTGMTFVYGEDVVLDYAINITVKNAELKDVLHKVLSQHNIDFSISKRHITLVKKKRPSADTHDEATTTHTINGYIKDHNSKETLIGATVYAINAKRGTVSNSYGFFSLTLHEGTSRLKFSYIGYDPQTIQIDLQADTTVTIEMVANNEIDEVTIEADRPETGTASSRTGATTIPIETIQKQPALLGEPDVLKTLQMLPGVQRGMVGTSGIHVRGGSPDQNLYLLDGVPMYNIDHIMGFISAFTPDAVKHVEFYKASFPARYGGRLSSVIDVRTKDGNMKEWHGMGQIGTLSSHMSLEGPINKDKTSLILSARRTYFDLLAAPIVKMQNDDIDKFKLHFYDINAKVNHIFSDDDRLYASFYMGRDVLSFKSQYNEGSSSYKDSFESDLRWGNTLGSLRWNHIFTPQLFSNATLAYNKFNFGIHIEDMSEYYGTKELQKTKYNSGIDDMTATIDFDYHPAHNHHIKYGGQYIRHIFRPSITWAMTMTESRDEKEQNTYDNDSQKTVGNEIDLYADDDMSIGDRCQMNAGIHATLFGVDSKTYINAEPRLSAALLLGQGWRAKASYTTMHQYVHLLQTAPISLPSDLWVPIDKNIKPMFSQQMSVGLSYSTITAWEFTAEAYYKEMKHILDYKDGANFGGTSTGWQEQVSEGKGISRGLEIMVRKTAGRTTGTASYTLAKTDRQYGKEICSGIRFPYKYDRRNVVNISIIHKLNSKIDVAASWNFMSGSWETLAKQMTTYIYEEYDGELYDEMGNILSYGPKYRTEDCEYYDRRNNFHLKPSHQLDLSINFHKKLKHSERTLNISIINAYNKKNQDIVYTTRKAIIEKKEYIDQNGWTHYEEHVARKKTVLKQMSIVPIIPSISYTIHF